MLKALLWKDLRLQRVALLAALCVIVFLESRELRPQPTHLTRAGWSVKIAATAETTLPPIGSCGRRQD